MHPRSPRSLACFAVFAAVAALRAQGTIVYEARIAVAERQVHVEMAVPAKELQELDLWMATWSPGFYHQENHWKQVADVRVRGDGKELAVDQPKPNHWRVQTGGASQVLVTYTVKAGGRSVTGDLVGDDYAILNGPASWLTFDAASAWPREVHVELPAAWPATASGLLPAKDGKPNHYAAPDYDALADSPIVAGVLKTSEFEAGGVPHRFVDFGDVGDWNGAAAATAMQPVLAEHARMLGGLPWDHYVFLNVFGPGGGGLEHKFSTLISSDKRGKPTDAQWLAFVSHEYFHAFNVKRLRPVELGPFDYETPPRTGSLWIAEGLTSYYGDLAVVRSGMISPADWLALASEHLRRLMATPGRSVMTLERASLDVFTTSMSGVMGAPQKTVSYYDKGPVVGLMLDARIRRLTDGKRSLDDVMRLAGSRYSGEHGYRHEEWQAVAAEVAGEDLKPFFDATLRSTDELDLAEALQWFGLRVRPVDEAAGKPARDQRWRLEPRPDATAAQKEHFAALLAATPAK